jgi:hypothetical protein
MSEDSLDILNDGYRPWPRVKEGTEASWDFYDIHDRNKATDLDVLRKYQDRVDIDTYKVVLEEVLHLFGQGIHESLTRTMGKYLEATGGRLSNNNKTPWEKEIAAKMICTNNPAEGPFATVKAFLNMYPSLKLRTVASLSAAICNGTHRPRHGTGENARDAGLALTSPAKVKEAVTRLCSVRTNSPGAVTVMMREKNVADEVHANLERVKRKKERMAKKAKAHANKMTRVDVALETSLAESHAELDAELLSFGNGKMAKLKYLEDQYKSRKLLRNGKYLSIPTSSKYRSTAKPYPLRMKPHHDPTRKTTTMDCIEYLQTLLHLMITEDLARPLEPTEAGEDIKIVRRLPVVSEVYINPLSIRLKTEQEERVKAMAAPVDDPWLLRFQREYVGKILYDNGYFRVFAVSYVPNTGSKTRYACWEATAEPGYIENGHFVVDERHLTTAANGSKILLKSSRVGFALAEYSKGDDADPVPLTFADECHARYLQRQARIASASANAAPRRRQKAQLPASSQAFATRRSSRSRSDSANTSTSTNAQ